MIALINDSTFLSSNGLLTDDVRYGARLFTQLCYSHVKKEGNKVAHNLTQYTLCFLDFIIWMEDVPPHFLFVFQTKIVGFYFILLYIYIYIHKIEILF